MSRRVYCQRDTETEKCDRYFLQNLASYWSKPCQKKFSWTSDHPGPRDRTFATDRFEIKFCGFRLRSLPGRTDPRTLKTFFDMVFYPYWLSFPGIYDWFSQTSDLGVISLLGARRGVACFVKSGSFQNSFLGVFVVLESDFSWPTSKIKPQISHLGTHLPARAQNGVTLNTLVSLGPFVWP